VSDLRDTAVATEVGQERPARALNPPGMRLRVAAVLVWIGLAVACVLALDPLAAALVGALGCAVLVAVTVTDLERRIIPNRIIVPALVAALVVQTIREPSVEWLVAALGAGAFFLVFALIYPAGLGMGDVKLAAFLGAWLGRDVVVALFAGSVLAAIPAVGVLLVRGSAGRKVGLPFAPFLAAGGVVALFFGDRALDAWLG
jgi:leader peptidase (prepilin peptidase)/N-methyltransferase